MKRDICCEGEFRSIETSTGRRARFEKKPGMDISRGRMLHALSILRIPGMDASRGKVGDLRVVGWLMRVHLFVSRISFRSFTRHSFRRI